MYMHDRMPEVCTKINAKVYITIKVRVHVIACVHMCVSPQARLRLMASGETTSHPLAVAAARVILLAAGASECVGRERQCVGLGWPEQTAHP